MVRQQRRCSFTHTELAANTALTASSDANTEDLKLISQTGHRTDRTVTAVTMPISLLTPSPYLMLELAI